MMSRAVTESDSLWSNLESMTIGELLKGINLEDKRVADVVEETIPQIEKVVEELVSRIKEGGRLFYLGAGTSGRLGILDASEIPPTFGAPYDLVVALIAGGDGAIRRAVEEAEDNPNQGWEDLLKNGVEQGDVVIGIAASGTTPYVVGALGRAREKGIFTAGITCNPNSPLSKVAHVAIEAVVGPEFVTGSTRMKGGSAQKMILNMITTTTMIKLGRVKGNKMVDMQLTNEKLIERGVRMIIEEIGAIEPDEARALLLTHNSVRNAVEFYFNEIDIEDE
ncbi:MAG: N-acetylmuramic acid 6-phosphate etherase [Bacteroidales bacterium]